MHVCNAPQPFTRIGYALEPLLPVGDRLFHVPIENGMQDFFFAFEVEVNGAVGDAGFACNVGDFRIEVTVVCKYLNGRAQNGPTFVGDYRTIWVNGTGSTHR